MTQKKYEKRLAKKQFLSLMIRKTEIREILRERKERARQLKQQHEMDDMIDEILLHYKETESVVQHICESNKNEKTTFLFTYFEDNIRSWLFQGCRNQSLTFYTITRKEYDQLLFHFDVIKKYIFKNELI